MNSVLLRFEPIIHPDSNVARRGRDGDPRFGRIVGNVLLQVRKLFGTADLMIEAFALPEMAVPVEKLVDLR